MVRQAWSRCWLVSVALLASLESCAACNPDHSSSTVDEDGDVGALAHYRPYPHGRWRLLLQPKLGQIPLWVSHILIRHDHSTLEEPPFSPGNWPIMAPAPQRSREQAFALASRIMVEAASGTDFARLARDHSEDSTTAALGGSLGSALPALELTPWPSVLDALWTLRSGEVSRVVETPFGFHVFRRRPPPRPARVSGRRLVLGYDRAGWFMLTASRAATVTRTRQAALELAQQIVRDARAAPEQFEQLVERYSEYDDATSGGDLGSWSTHEPAVAVYRQLDVLLALKEGEVADPIDTPFGFQIIQRVPEARRETYAITGIGLAYDRSLPEAAPGSRLASKRLAEELFESVIDDPGRLTRLQREYCCPGIVQWRHGRGPLGLDAVLRTMKEGDLAPEVVESEGKFLVFRRVAPEEEPEEITAAVDLPAVAAVDLQDVVLSLDTPELARLTRGAGANGSAVLALNQAERDAFVRIHEEAAENFETAINAEERVEALQRVQAKLQTLLGGARATDYVVWLQARVEEVVLAHD